MDVSIASLLPLPAKPERAQYLRPDPISLGPPSAAAWWPSLVLAGEGGGTGASRPMDEREFKGMLALFPVVRSRDFCADQDASGGSTSHPAHDALVDWHDVWDNGDKNDQNNDRMDANDAFWKKLKWTVERKVGVTEAEKFCSAFQQAHRKLVYEVMNADAAKKYIESSSILEE